MPGTFLLERSVSVNPKLVLFLPVHILQIFTFRRPAFSVPACETTTAIVFWQFLIRAQSVSWTDGRGGVAEIVNESCGMYRENTGQ